MSINITAENVHDAADKLGIERRRSGINITWRRGADYGNEPEQGCIVDATDISTEEVKRAFKSSKEALVYIASLLKRHDDYAKEKKAERDKHMSDAIKAAKPLKRRRTDR
jgi:hypothetical protein